MAIFLDEKIGEHFFNLPTKVLFFFLSAMLKCEAERRTGYIRADSLDKKGLSYKQCQKAGNDSEKKAGKKTRVKG
ncbi:hypothetical protein BK049_14760 [Bacillus xiamenensis]|uniref:Uncharacterized protein n=1 Tax=Bacillus xiamenensis TaxID=1178537 RepID=A0AAC9IJJ3_9BACI|nr:hypothetical protein BK049_14760 [Bacillus xiamenensis]